MRRTYLFRLLHGAWRLQGVRPQSCAMARKHAIEAQTQTPGRIQKVDPLIGGPILLRVLYRNWEARSTLKLRILRLPKSLTRMAPNLPHPKPQNIASPQHMSSFEKLRSNMKDEKTLLKTGAINKIIRNINKPVVPCTLNTLDHDVTVLYFYTPSQDHIQGTPKSQALNPKS